MCNFLLLIYLKYESYLKYVFHWCSVLLYYFFNPEIAYWINDFTVKILAYFSFYIFAKKISSQIFICGLVSCLYASINDRTLDGFGFAIIPYIIYLISFKKNIKIKHFLIVAVLGANTDLVYIMPVIPAVIAAANFLEYPCFSMAGINIEPRAEVSATAEPDNPANNMDDKTFTCANPPLRCPINA